MPSGWLGPQDTVRRLEVALKAKGMTVFARIDHAAGAAEVGLTLSPTDLVIFGNARGGTPLMQSDQTMGIDLPLKALVWQDAAGKTWLSTMIRPSAHLPCRTTRLSAAAVRAPWTP